MGFAIEDDGSVVIQKNTRLTLKRGDDDIIYLTGAQWVAGTYTPDFYEPIALHGDEEIKIKLE